MTKDDETQDDSLPGAEDLQHMTKEEVWQFFHSSVSPRYKADFHPGLIGEALDEVSSLSDIEEKVAQLERMQQVLTHGLSLEVMDHYDQLGIPYSVSGFQNLSLMQEAIMNGSAAAHHSRETLLKTKTKVETQYLRLLRLCRRAETMKKLSMELDQFAAICYSISLSIKQATKKGEMYHALELCKSASQRLSEIDYKRFDVLRSISANVEKKTAKVFLKVKSRLAQLCRAFDSDVYENVLLAYASAYDPSQIALVKFRQNIQGEFMTAISHSSKTAIDHWLPEEVKKLQLQSAIHLLPVQMYLEAMRELFKTFSEFLYNNHLFSRWHLDNEYVSHSLGSGKGCLITKSYVLDETRLSKLAEAYAYVQDDLLRNRKYLWEKMQQKAGNLFDQGEQFLTLQPVEVTKLLTWTDTFLRLGEDFSGAFSTELRTAIKAKVSQFYAKIQTQTWTSLL
jgi:hypothetical protein